MTREIIKKPGTQPQAKPATQPAAKPAAQAAAKPAPQATAKPAAQVTPPEPEAPPIEPEYVDVDEQTGDVDLAAIKIGALKSLLQRTDLDQRVTAGDAATQGQGCTAWVDLGCEGIPMINITERRSTGIAAIDALMATIQYANLKYGLVPVDRSSRIPETTAGRSKNGPAMAQSKPSAREPKYPDGPQKPTNHNQAPAAVPGSEYDPEVVHTFPCTKLEVVPKPGGKANLNFYGDGRKYADLWCTWDIPAILKSLPATGYEWTEEHFRVAEAYGVPFRVQWRYSEKVNDKGKPYKNIIGFLPPQ